MSEDSRKKPPKKGHDSPWLKGVKGVKGIVPPGRRLSDPNERRPTEWSASGVQGVTPPGNLAKHEGPAVDWAEREANKKEEDGKRARRKHETVRRSGGEDLEPFDPMRPMAGYVPHAFADLNDPKDMRAFLNDISAFVEKSDVVPECAADFAALITQSRAPFEIVVAFGILSIMVRTNSRMRRRYAAGLERGAKVFFNLARRINPEAKIPRGLLPQTVDAIFFDLPDIALRIPFAYATAAFIRMMELLRSASDLQQDRKLGEFGLDLHERFIAGRSFGDEALERMFPLTLPDWVPAETFE